jgi:predicted TIM-barrel fold metal-dependent hydrolase
MVIDTHVHFIRPFDSRGRRQVYTPPDRPASVEDYLALMDASGIDRAFFISWSPEDIPSDLLVKGIDPQTVQETMNREYALEVMRRFPERFYWFPCHLGPLVPNYLAMAEENLRLGAAGLKLVCSFWGELPDDPRLRPMYDLAERHGAQIILDTSFWYLGKDEPADPATLPSGHREVAMRVKNFEDYLRHLRPVVAAHPKVNFQLAHAGARSFTPENAEEVGEFIRQYPNLYADLGALDPEAAALDVLVLHAGADRVMFGTDWPHFARGEAMTEAIECIRWRGRFQGGVAEQILGGNAMAFVKGRRPGLAE